MLFRAKVAQGTGLDAHIESSFLQPEIVCGWLDGPLIKDGRSMLSWVEYRLSEFHCIEVRDFSNAHN
jgi:hypothetical protein